MKRKRRCFVKLLMVCLLSLCIVSEAGVCKKVFAQDYLYYGTLSINWKGWKAYACGMNYELSGGTSGTLYENSPLAVIDVKVNSIGNSVARCWSPVLSKTVYVSEKYIKKTEESTLTEVREEFQYKFIESESYTKLKSLIRELKESSTYADVHTLKSNAVNTNIRGVYSSITSLNEVIFLEGIEDIEKSIYVAAYNDAELGEVKNLVEKLENCLNVVVEGIDTYRAYLYNTSYWTKKFNPKINSVIDDCNRVVSAVNAVIDEDMYARQVNAAMNDRKANANTASARVVELILDDYGNNPRHIPGGNPYNKLNNSSRQWCVDYVQYMLTQEESYCKSKLCGTVDVLVESVSDYGGTYYVTANSKFKYNSVATRESLKESSYAKTIHMDYNYTADTMDVRPGDVIVYGKDGYGGTTDYRFAHVGIVVEVNEDGSFKTIEGNTTYAGYSGQCLNQKYRSGLGWSTTIGNKETGYAYYIVGVLRPNYEGTITVDNLK